MAIIVSWPRFCWGTPGHDKLTMTAKTAHRPSRLIHWTTTDQGAAYERGGIRSVGLLIWKIQREAKTERERTTHQIMEAVRTVGNPRRRRWKTDCGIWPAKNLHIHIYGYRSETNDGGSAGTRLQNLFRPPTLPTSIQLNPCLTGFSVDNNLLIP